MTHQDLTRSLALASLALAASTAHADIQITEWMYSSSGSGGEFVEFTNLGSAPVNFAGWSYSDSARSAGLVSLSAFGIVAPGESLILTESSAADFRSAWGLAAAVKVIGDNTVGNLGRADEINLYNGAALVDRLSYGDQSFAGTIRTQGASGTPNSLAALDSQTVTSQWVLASNADAWGSHASTLGDLGNPGVFALAAAPVPEPASYALLLAGLGAVGLLARRRR